ncbi:MAG TPA: bifunctional 3,4-dihydroxy-2-butanone-4-phosphate synthase/GTP cyclohydrolase II [Pseudogracilibacillus sp.]|nr:bifunctional 3,4-dihydroxy-2-butanone-4-phosphate synthase/GTP cyclohydrolase II [Pseudogracilibacillus sp.]
MFHSIEDAVADLRAGKVVIVVDDEDRENEGDFVALSETITPETVNFMITHGKGLVCVTVTEQLAHSLHLPLMTNESTDPYETAFTISIDHRETTTGISAYERALTIKALTDEATTKDDFKRPGHVFPLIAKNGGVIERPGHTEAAVDLAKLSGAFPSGVICEIINEDGTMARVPELLLIAEQFHLKIITIADLIKYRKKHEQLIRREVKTNVQTAYGTFQMVGYSNVIDDKEHLALVKGELQSESVLARIHSECLTGDVFHSYRCDCGPQLDEALKRIAERGSGVLIYMRQEGRGIGLLNKLRAYELQEEGLDTVEANEALGFAADLREYEISAHILKDLGVHSVELMTNNPKKVLGLEENGIVVERRIPLERGIRKENERYIKTKREKLNHLFTVEK